MWLPSVLSATFHVCEMELPLWLLTTVPSMESSMRSTALSSWADALMVNGAVTTWFATMLRPEKTGPAVSARGITTTLWALVRSAPEVLSAVTAY